MSKEVIVLEYTCLICGPKDSPACANYAEQKTIRDAEFKFPKTAKAVQDRTFMGDHLDSFENAGQAQRSFTQSGDIVPTQMFSARQKFPVLY